MPRNLIQDLSGAPLAPDLEGIRANYEDGYYANEGRSEDLARDLRALYPEGTEDAARANELATLAENGEYDELTPAPPQEPAALEGPTGPVGAEGTQGAEPPPQG